MGIQGLSQFSGCRFRKHGKNQLQRGHVVSKIFFLQVFEILDMKDLLSSTKC
jgi:hypothetical protein